MQRLTLEELDAEAAALDSAVASSPEIDRFCSSSSWVLPASRSIMPPRRPWIWRGDEGYLALMSGVHEEGWRYLEPLEAAWGLACPLLGPDGALLARELRARLEAEPQSWHVALLSGLPRGALLEELVRQLSSRFSMRAGALTRRHVASLSGGVDGFLARRSRSLRRSLRRAEERASRAGIYFEICRARDAGGPAALYERLLAVEARSWKSREGSGLANPEMRAFYSDMLARLAARAAERLIFAVHEGRDVAYILGGVFAGGYRGLQFSFDDAYRPYSLGGLCQLRQIDALCREGILSYDLGTEMEYKQRWGEITFDTLTLIVQRS